jgi:hypothetical protein
MFMKAFCFQRVGMELRLPSVLGNLKALCLTVLLCMYVPTNETSSEQDCVTSPLPRSMSAVKHVAAMQDI